jgi:cholesterol transport system auxiliary component
VHILIQRSALLMWSAAIVLCFIMMSGCGKPPIVTNRYLLEYPSPVFGGKPTLDESVKVELFAVARSISNRDMVYFPKPFETSSYVYNKWEVDPSHMVTDFLLRDLRKSNLFKGVFGYQQSGIGRFKVEGAVQQFAEMDEPDGWKAVLAVSVTLLDMSEAEITKRVIFQKNYRQAELMPEQNPVGLAQGMSRAMEVVSAKIINDLYKAAAARVCHQ